MVAERRYPHRVGQTYRLKFNPQHRWVYFPEMRRDEAVVFKVYDSDKNRARFTAHTSFADPATPSNAPLRQSIEIRAFAFFASWSSVFTVKLFLWDSLSIKVVGIPGSLSKGSFNRGLLRVAIDGREYAPAYSEVPRTLRSMDCPLQTGARSSKIRFLDVILGRRYLT